MAVIYDAHKTLAASLVATAPSPASSGTTLNVTAASGANFPAAPFNVTVWPAGTRPSLANAEIVRVTSKGTGDDWTITRAQEGTSARTIVVGDNIAATITPKTLTDIEWGLPHVTQGRLTLTTALPVTTADVTAATTIYFTPYKGNRISLFDGTNWKLYTFTEVSVALGTLTNDLPYDVFIYDNAGTITLEMVAWSNKTTRVTALALQDGVYSKTGSLTKKYLGTFHTTATTTTEDSFRRRLLWNYYNRVRRALRKYDTTASWAYTGAIRQANGDATNQVEVVVGVAEVEIYVESYATASNTTAPANEAVGVGEDSVAAGASDGEWGLIRNVTAGALLHSKSRLRKYPTVGYHYYAWLEYTDTGGAVTWYGTAALSTTLPISGILGEIDG